MDFLKNYQIFGKTIILTFIYFYYDENYFVFMLFYVRFNILILLTH